jgi:hypothetical protein
MVMMGNVLERGRAKGRCGREGVRVIYIYTEDLNQKRRRTNGFIFFFIR